MITTLKCHLCVKSNSKTHERKLCRSCFSLDLGLIMIDLPEFFSFIKQMLNYPPIYCFPMLFLHIFSYEISIEQINDFIFNLRFLHLIIL